MCITFQNPITFPRYKVYNGIIKSHVSSNEKNELFCRGEFFSHCYVVTILVLKLVQFNKYLW